MQRTARFIGPLETHLAVDNEREPVHEGSVREHILDLPLGTAVHGVLSPLGDQETLACSGQGQRPSSPTGVRWRNRPAGLSATVLRVAVLARGDASQPLLYF